MGMWAVIPCDSDKWFSLTRFYPQHFLDCRSNISLIVAKFHDISIFSKFSRQAVTFQVVTVKVNVDLYRTSS